MLLDFSPGEVNAVAFLLGQAARWVGVGLFFLVAWRLGRHLEDWRIPALAVVAVAVPALWAEFGWALVRETDGFGDAISRGEASAVLAVGREAFRVAALAALIVLSARLVSERRLEVVNAAAR